MARTIDHLVLAAPSLESGCDYVEERWGIRPVLGGRHLPMGTHNALLDLGNQCYLEVIARDPESKVPVPAWMGVDKVTKPTFTRWCIDSKNLAADRLTLSAFADGLSEVWDGERQTEAGDLLKWKMLLPKAEPLIELAPFAVDWSASAYHPTERLRPGLVLQDFVLYSPRPQHYAALFAALQIEIEVIGAKENRIVVLLE